MQVWSWPAGFILSEVQMQNNCGTGECLCHAGVELASGLHWFLKYKCQSALTWHRTGGNSIQVSCLEEDALDRLAKGKYTLYRGRPLRWAYYQNVVTARCGSPCMFIKAKHNIHHSQTQQD
jgi:hypothetical protein